ncbi:hypothetical protein ABGB17_23310 [Sphaerisporangium sp. B11E5]|uniref:hypothetical protein n=1 Tax=Sphaerisporangium sp. B11E5 TaxID=3153563 RepID=UPI00325EC21D
MTAEQGAATLHLGAMRGAVGDDEPQISVLREASPEEIDQTKSAISLLSFMVEVNPIGDLRAAADRIVNLVRELVKSNRTDSAFVNLISRRVHMGVDDWLRSLRSLDDHTAHWLSGRFGKDSDELKSFRNAASEAFDDYFAYRFCCKLRNYSQHVGQALQNFTYGGMEVEPGEFEHYLKLEFDSRSLLSQYDGWGSIVKADLESVGGIFDFFPVLNSTMLATERMLARTFIALEVHLREAIRVVKAKAEEVAEFGEPFFMEVPPDLGEQTSRFTVKMSAIKSSLAVTAEDSLRQSRFVLGLPPIGVR